MNLRNVDLNLLVLFDTIYSSGNISHAARQLNMSQPAISNALARLRDQLDDPLFVRSGKGVVATPKADALKDPVREALALIGKGLQAKTEFDVANDRRCFRVLDTVDSIPLATIIQEVSAQRNISFELLPYFGTDLFGGLSDGTIDLLCHVFTPSDDELNFQKVYEVDCFAVTRKNHPEINGNLDLETYCKLGQLALVPQMRIQTHVEEQLQAQNIDRNIVFSVTEFRRMPAILAETDLIAILPKHIALRGQKYYEIDLHEVPFPVPIRNFYLIWRKNRDQDAGLAWLRNRISAAIKLEQASFGLD